MAERRKTKNEAWSAYPETVLVFQGEPEIMIDLREPIAPATKKALTALGFGDPFAILTPHNPRGENIDASENERRFREFEAELRSTGIEYNIIDACSPDTSHCECSAAVKTDMKRAIDIAVRWEQVAIFWWDGERFWIYGAISPIDPPISLPVFEDVSVASPQLPERHKNT